MSVSVLLIIMLNPIEFFEVADKYEIELEFKTGVPKKFNCRCDISYNNTVTAIYDSDDEVIATTMRDLAELGVVKATVKALHEVEL